MAELSEKLTFVFYCISTLNTTLFPTGNATFLKFFEECRSVRMTLAQGQNAKGQQQNGGTGFFASYSQNHLTKCT